MKLPKILTALAATALLLAGGAAVTAERAVSDYVEGIDWKNKVVTVTGEGVAPTNAQNYTQAKGMASRAAQADAYRKLGEMINGVRVEGETTVENMLTTKDTVKLRVSATIKGAKILKETFLSDGGYRVTMQVPIFGMSNSLAGAVFERNSTIEPFPDPVFEENQNFSTPYQSNQNFSKPYQSPLSRMSAVSTLGTNNLQNLQENSLTVTEPIYQPTAYTGYQVSDATPNQMAKRSVEDYASKAEGTYTGLIVDCRGLDLQPVMSPVIKNTNGTKIYGHKNLDIDEVIKRGMADYIDDTANVGRAGDNPLVVKAQAVENFNSNPVVAIPDSNRILIENHATKFLKDLNVVFLFD